MCSSLFWRKMETDEGDLADIVKVGGVRTNVVDKGSVLDWQFSSIPTNFPAIKTGKSLDELGDLLSSKNDPLMNELGFSASMAIDNFSGFEKLNTDHQEMNNPYSTFSRILQISSNAKVISREGKSAALSFEFGRDKSTDSIGCPTESFSTQISSQNLSIKRRKNQARKVICVPAPTTANSRPTGEIVPSDPWAWRKYGQKPIKGSPYPRGYYRCSSSKGCPARKQVERSRQDPNMLVITYTSEHNHQWPMQRNALAGSTRPQATKNNLRNSATSQTQKSTTLKEEGKKINGDNSSDIVNKESIECSSIKEETTDAGKPLEIDDLSDFSQGFTENHEQFLADSNHSDDYFADLGELEKDPVQLIFSGGFTDQENKNMDPFSIFDW